jgi:hypothetical protein
MVSIFSFRVAHSNRRRQVYRAASLSGRLATQDQRQSDAMAARGYLDAFEPGASASIAAQLFNERHQAWFQKH